MATDKQRILRVGFVLGIVREIFKNGNHVLYIELVNQTCVRFGSSIRTSQEYVRVALSQIDHRIERLEGKQWIIPEKQALL